MNTMAGFTAAGLPGLLGHVSMVVIARSQGSNLTLPCDAHVPLSVALFPPYVIVPHQFYLHA